MPTIKIPDITIPPRSEGTGEDRSTEFGLQDLEVTEKQASRWNELNEKDQLALVLKADREHRDVRDYL